MTDDNNNIQKEFHYDANIHHSVFMNRKTINNDTIEVNSNSVNVKISQISQQITQLQALKQELEADLVEIIKAESQRDAEIEAINKAKQGKV
jgi:virulence-associated protein VapD